MSELPRALGGAALVLAGFGLFVMAFLVAPLAVLGVFVAGLAAAARARRS